MQECDIKEALKKELEATHPDVKRIAELTDSLLDLATDSIRFSVDAHHINRLGLELVATQELSQRSLADILNISIISGMSMKSKPPLDQFRISSALKTLIGKELITDDYIAVFELIKNSYDAFARKVDVVFENDKIIIQDDGTGMDEDDIRNKWLFVAYSAKRNIATSKGGRRNITQSVRQIAGAKGVGRFSCDRLGQHLILETRKGHKHKGVKLIVNWGEFEVDSKREFVDIKIKYDDKSNLRHIKNKGTALVISGLREKWDREKLLGLRHHLQRLIHPNEVSKDDSFSIHIKADHEKTADDNRFQELEQQFGKKNIPPSIIQRQVVNGPVENLLFDELGVKTTEIIVSISQKTIETTLIDRGELIYKVRKKNFFNELHDIKFHLFYLNRSAKLKFHKIMGIANVQFGSVFLFRNGFRVYPIGEPGDDSFGIDRRRAQGYARHFGTRDILGYIDIQDKREEFKEATSRDGGLIKSKASEQLEKCFMEQCLKPLEDYVVGALWKIKDDKDVDSIKLLLNDPSRARVIDIVSKVLKVDDVEIVEYSKNLISIVQDKLDKYVDTLEGLKRIAEKANNKELLEQIRLSEERFFALKKAEQEAKGELAREKRAREEAERKTQDVEREKQQLKDELKKEKEVSLFLKSIQSLDADIVVNLHHQIAICSSTIANSLRAASLKLDKGVDDPHVFLSSLIEKLSFENRKISAITKFATKANFRMESEVIEADLATYCAQYLDNVQSLYEGSGLSVDVKKDCGAFKIKFKPIEMVILLDNLISNSRKAKASRITVSIWKEKDSLVILFEDNGIGLAKNVADKRKIFEKGFTTTYGSGLGMYHVGQILDTMGAQYQVVSEIGEKGFSLEVIIRR